MKKYKSSANIPSKNLILFSTKKSFLNNLHQIAGSIENKRESSLTSLTTALNTVIPEDETKLWHFVSITYTPNKLSLFVDGTAKEMSLLQNRSCSSQWQVWCLLWLPKLSEM